jgi:hypothetical protein
MLQTGQYVNATMLLLRMEADRFAQMKNEAWSHKGTLTPQGRVLVDKCSRQIPNHRDYSITKEEHDTYHEYAVSGNHNGLVTQTVKVSKELVYGCHTSLCTCGVPQTDSVPCCILLL